MEKVINLINVDVEQAKKLYVDSFGDSKEFTDMYFDSYAKNNKYYFWKQNDEIICMACLNIKRIYIDNQKHNVGFIVAVATKKEYQGKGLMKSFFQDWLDEINSMYDYIFIQAYNWNVYKSYDFIPCTYKNEYHVRKDQYLSPSKIFDKVDFDKMMVINDLFIKQNNIQNFSYKTKKEQKLYYKMLMATNDMIYMNKFCYIVMSNNVIADFAYTDLKEFIKLVSNFKDKNPIIKSYIPLPKTHFTIVSENNVDTKVYKKNNIDIYFNEAF